MQGVFSCLILTALAAGHQPTVLDLLPALPQMRNIELPGFPLMIKHGLIQVNMNPEETPALPPATVAERAVYNVASPGRGRVVDRTEPNYFCKKPGYVLEGTECVATNFEPARFVCPGGFDPYDEATCVRRNSIIQNCPVGYFQRDGTCAKMITTNFLEICPDGTIEAGPGVCHRQVPHPLTPTCPVGTYDHRSGACATTALVEARAYCPEGFNFLDGACVQEETYDCTHPHAHGFHFGLLGTLPGHTHKGKTLQATKSLISLQKTCTRVTSTAVIFACDEGMLQGNRCVVKQALPPTPLCRGLGDLDSCYAIQRVAALRECPPEYSRECIPGRPCECVAVEAAAFVTSCPRGFDMDGDGCVRTAEARPVCPSTHILEGADCVQILREPADCVFSVTYECEASPGHSCDHHQHHDHVHKHEQLHQQLAMKHDQMMQEHAMRHDQIMQEHALMHERAVQEHAIKKDQHAQLHERLMQDHAQRKEQYAQQVSAGHTHEPHAHEGHTHGHLQGSKHGL